MADTDGRNNRPEVKRSSKAAGSRPEVRQSSKAAGSRPKSATAAQKSRTTTGRPVNNGKTGGTPKTSGSQRSGKPGTQAKKSKNGKRRQQERVRLNPKAMYIAAGIVGILLALMITLIMRSSLMKVNQIETDYNMGDSFDITNYFETARKGAVIEYDNKEFAPDKLGTCKIKFKVRKGKLSRTKTAKINVVDEVTPYISGPKEIDVKVGQKVNWSDYYTVTDSDPDIQSKLKSSTELDTGKARAVNVLLTVTDWAGNTAEKSITVFVTDGDDI